MRRLRLLSLAATAIIVIGGCSKTEGTKTRSEQPKGAAVGTGGVATNTKDDGDLVHDVAIMNMAEIELSRMALDKSTQPDVKTFAQQLIDAYDMKVD